MGTEEDILVRLARSKGLVRGWDRNKGEGSDPRGRHLLTLVRDTEDTAWGFSLMGGREVLEHGGFWSGVATRRGEKGLWLSVSSVREETAAGKSGLKQRDLVTRINGRIVFHLEPGDVARLVRQSGTSLYLDVERVPSKDLLYNNGLHQFSYNFLYEDPLVPSSKAPVTSSRCKNLLASLNKYDSHITSPTKYNQRLPSYGRNTDSLATSYSSIWNNKTPISPTKYDLVASPASFNRFEYVIPSITLNH